MDRQRRSTAEKLALFRRYFTGLEAVYGSYDLRTGKAYQVKEHVTDAVLLAHLKGEQPYGVYLLDGAVTRAAAIDFDMDDPSLPAKLLSCAREVGLPVYIERSKSKGYHVWVFLEAPGVQASKARSVFACLLAGLNMPHAEIFPKQDSLGNGASYGNFINAPLFGALVPKGRTVFVDPENEMKPFADQWDFLEQVERVSEVQLDDILDSLGEEVTGGLEQGAATPQPSPIDVGHRVRFTPKSALPICAQRMLNDGVTENQRVACFRLAIHFNRLGIPFDITVAALNEWARKNRPADGKRTITDAEIAEQADWAYKKAYRGFGCDEPAVKAFCAPDCPLCARGNP